MKNFAVIGNPITHSKSPEIFKALFERFGLQANYLRISLNDAADITQMMQKYGISGINITSPFKEKVFKLLKDTDPISKKVEAVNVVISKNDSFYGFNTDVYGVQHSLLFNNVDVKGKKCIVVGSGGAGKSAIYALNDLGGIVFSCNRTDFKAEKISKDFECGFIKYDDLKENLSDTYLLVSAVSEISQDIKICIKDVIVLDANYRSSDLKNFCRKYIDGYDWLINQALRSFELFLDNKADPGNIKNEILNFKPKKNIALIGMTGSGKTAYGRIIAEHFGMKFVDSDEEIEKRCGMKIHEIFIFKGEDYFRKTEEEVISDFSAKKNILISIGAGALSSVRIREIIKKNYFSALLDIEPDQAISRLNEAEISKRPLLKEKDLKITLEEMFNERKDHYLSVADLIIKIGSGSIKDESDRIIKELDGR